MNSFSLLIFVVSLGIGLFAVLRLHRSILRASKTDWGIAWMNWVDGLNRLFCYRYHHLNITGLRLPKSGPAIVVSNHVSGLDPLLLIASSRRPLRFLIAREEYGRFGLTWLFKAMGCIPVDRERRPELALRAAMRALQAGEIVAIFPHGKIHLDGDPPRRLKRGAASLSQITGCDLYPARISGIRGAGHVLRGVLLPGEAQIRLFSPIKGEGVSAAQVMDQLEELINSPVTARESVREVEG